MTKRRPIDAARAAAVLSDRLGRTDEALALLDAELAKHPLKYTWLSLRANLLADAFRLDEALAALDRLDALRPGSAESAALRVWIAMRQDRWAEALAGIEAFRKTFGGNLVGWRNEVLAGLGRPDPALLAMEEAWMRRGLRNLPWFSGTRAGLAFFFATTNTHLDEGIKLAEEAIKMRPREPWFHYVLAELKYRSKDTAGAGAALDQALKLKPHFGRAKWLKAKLAR